MRAKLAAILFAAACPAMYAQVGNVDVAYQKFVLKNGLTLIVHEDHKAPIVDLRYSPGTDKTDMNFRRSLPETSLSVLSVPAQHVRTSCRVAFCRPVSPF